MRLSEFIEQSNAVDNTAELFALFGQAIGDLGYDKLAYADLTPSLTAGGSPTIHALSYPTDWVSYYFEQGYDQIDPSSLQLVASARPFAWSQLGELRNMTPDQSYVLEEARAAGLCTGVSVPLHGPMACWAPWPCRVR